MSLTVYRDNGDSAHAAHVVIVESLRQAEHHFLRAAEKLYEVIKLRHYKALGYSSFPAYCASIGISRSLGYTLAQVHEIFVLKANRPTVGLLDVGISKLSLLAARIEDGDIDIEDDEELDGWLYAGEVLSRPDLITELRANFGDDPDAPVPWRRKAALWKALAKKYYRYYRRYTGRENRKWLQQRKSSRNE